jgi:hypothetical protein
VGAVSSYVDAPATGRSLVQRSSTGCVCVRACVPVVMCDQGKNNLYTYNEKEQRVQTLKGNKKEKVLCLRVFVTYKRLWSYFILSDFVDFIFNCIFSFFPGEYQTIVPLVEVHREFGKFLLLFIRLLPPFSKGMTVHSTSYVQ